MKKIILFLLIILLANFSYGQTTWVQRISYNQSNVFEYSDSTCGIQDISVSPDGNLYMIGKTSQSNYKYIFKMTPDTHTILWKGAETHEHQMLGDDKSFVRATADSGCIVALSHHGSSFELSSTIIKYSKSGIAEWLDSLGSRYDTLGNFINYYTDDIIQNAAGNYYALMRVWPGFGPENDSLLELDNTGAVIFGTPIIHGNRLFEMNNGDLLLVRHTNILYVDSLMRTDLSGNIAWGVQTDWQDLYAFSDSTAFICHKDTAALLSTIRKINVINGHVIWTDSIPTLFVSGLDATMDGGVIVSEGMRADFYLAATSMNGKLYKIDNAGTIQWIHVYTFPRFGLSTVKQYPDGRFITGGTYHSRVMDLVFPRDYSGFAAMVDSSGNGALETAQNMWPGDANANDSLWALEEIMYMALAWNSTGLPRDTFYDAPPPSLGPFFCSDYASDWQQVFPNGTNYKHADLTGDGIIDSADINAFLPYQIFWGGPTPLFYRISDNSSGLANLLLLSEKDSVAPGEMMRFYIITGNSSQHIDSILGISFSCDFDLNLVDTSVTNTAFFDNDLGNPVSNLLCFSQRLYGSILIIAARNDKQNVYQLYDTLGVIELKANANVTSPQIFNLQISSHYAMTSSTAQVSLNPVNGNVVIDPALVSVKENNASNISVFPVPANKFLSVNNLAEGEKQICIYNLAGKKMKNIFSSGTNLKIPVGGLENGIYNITVSSGNESMNEKFVVMH